MIDARLTILENLRIAPNVNILRYQAPKEYKNIRAGQFVEIKSWGLHFPFLRRPMSVFEYEGKYFSVMIKIAGEGTRQMYETKAGEKHFVLGPLGKPFNIDKGEEFSVLLGAGVGAAPMLLLEKELKKKSKSFQTFLAAQTKNELVSDFFTEPIISTDDGSAGFHGNILQCFDANRKNFQKKKIKIYACGPLAFLKAAQEYALKNKIHCELSLETTMGCGFGICMGCAVEASDKKIYDGESKGMYLACLDGPCIDARKIKLH